MKPPSGASAPSAPVTRDSHVGEALDSNGADRELHLVGDEEIDHAVAAVAGIVQRTPLEASRALSELVGASVLLKCEHLQRTGSFKMRGATMRISRLTPDEQAAGVVAASAGNHAQGVALAATLQGVQSTVFMPERAPLPKVEATRGYGATVELVPGQFADSMGAAQAHARSTGKVFVHPFDHRDIIAGQATVGRELLDQHADFDTVVVPVGGGGLISGVAAAIKHARPDVRIIGVEAAGAASMRASLDSGRPTQVHGGHTIADGIAVKKPGPLTLAHVTQLVDDVVQVNDQEMALALTMLLERAKQVVEPSGAAAVAGMLTGRVDLGETAIAVLSGGNIDPMMLDQLVRAGLDEEGRHVTLLTRVPDQPGELVAFLEVLAALRANVVGVEHYRFGGRRRLGTVDIMVELEVRGHEHTTRIVEELRTRGYQLTRSPTMAPGQPLTTM